MTAGFATAETQWVGDKLCVYQPDTNALCLLNKTAGAFWLARADGSTLQTFADAVAAEHRVATHDVLEGLMSAEQHWSEAGLVWQGKPLERAPMIGDAIAPIVEAAPPPTMERQRNRPLELDGFYKSARGGVLRLSVDERELSGLLSAVLAPLQQVAHDDGARADGALALSAAGENGYGIWRDGQFVMGPVDRTTARRVAIRNVLFHFWPTSMIGGMIHGSAVCRGNEAVVIAGLSGSGKSTLTAAAIAGGWSYLSDDFVPVLRCGRRVGRFATALSVKSGSWPLLECSYPWLSTLPTFQMGPRVARYMPVDQGRLGPADARVRAMVFPNVGQAGAGSARLERLDPTDVLERLIESGSGPDGQPHTIGALVDLVCGVPGYALHYADLEDGLGLLDEVASS